MVEEYEARLLYSADLAGAGLALAGVGDVVEQRFIDNHGEFTQVAQAEQRSHELLIVGAGIADSRTLLDGLARDGRDIEVLVLDPAQDSMSQISAALGNRHDLSAIHILSHGSSGQLQLGADSLDATLLAARAGEVGHWGDALRAGGDILLYGCDVAAGETGAAFVRQLSALTGADVAASTNLTGDTALQGDWNLEFSTGHIETAIAFTAASQMQWHGELSSTPIITGTASAQLVNDNASLNPFAAVTIIMTKDQAHLLAVSVSIDVPAQGALSGTSGSYDAVTGVYTLTGTAAQATAALRALVFTPTPNRVAPGLTETTRLTISAADGQLTTTDTNTTVVATSINDAPVITGTAPAQPVNDNTKLNPFAAVTVTDADNPTQQLTVRVSIDVPAQGALSGTSGSYDAVTGVYTVTGTAAQATAALRALVFTPTPNRVAPGLTETTRLTISAADGQLTTTDTNTTVVATSINDAPVITGTAAAQPVNDNASLNPFAAVTVTDADNPAQQLTVRVSIDVPAQGALSGTSGSYDAVTGVYTVTGTAAQATAALRALVFTPSPNRVAPGLTETTRFTISADDGLSTTTDANTTVVATSTAVAARPPAAAPPQTTQPQETQPAQPQAPALAFPSPPSPAPFTAAAVETPAVAATEPTGVPAAGPAPASNAALAATSSLQLEAALPLPEAVFSAPTNQQPGTVVATPARSGGERASQAAATLLATAATVDVKSEAQLAADLSAAQALVDSRIERASAAARSETLARSLDQMRDSVKSAEEAEHRIVGSSVAVGTSFSVGYVIWLLRGGVLATSLLSSLPAWRFVDPLPVLARMRQGSDDDSDDSLESLVADDDGQAGNEDHEGRGIHGAGQLQALESKP